MTTALDTQAQTDARVRGMALQEREIGSDWIVEELAAGTLTMRAHAVQAAAARQVPGHAPVTRRCVCADKCCRRRLHLFFFSTKHFCRRAIPAGRILDYSVAPLAYKCRDGSSWLYHIFMYTHTRRAWRGNGVLDNASSRDTGKVGLHRLCQVMNLDGFAKPGTSSVKRHSYGLGHQSRRYAVQR